jgi:hypothetical protein
MGRLPVLQIILHLEDGLAQEGTAMIVEWPAASLALPVGIPDVAAEGRAYSQQGGTDAMDLADPANLGLSR